jgi:hypothetical protein
MRFLSDGPDIPDDLLIARDEGRVVFFCGSGVSKARAKLPDFYELANTVITYLGTSQDSPANKLFKIAQDLKKQTGLDNLISADRIFGLLERDFFSREIESAVALALKPQDDVDLTAHRIILDLATTDGKVKIVTTNFDRLFDQCKSGITLHTPPRLPDIANDEEIDGIVHLHGCSNIQYNSTESTGFVLSSAEFGNAYLADGWATRFYKEIIQKYVVVFIGYSADDPPVQYLLEAFNKKTGQFKDVYAFQVGDKVDAISKWAHKGIKAIPYKDGAGHSSLWDSLEEWSSRARDPQKWIELILEKSRLGPSSLRPHERGQVAHIVSSTEGAKAFAKFEPPPPAEWLCVFDSAKRLEKPGEVGSYEARELFVPFDHYGLDSDEIPETSEPNKLNQERDPLDTPWDCFTTNTNDLKESSQSNYSTLSGHYSQVPTPLLPRVQQILVWLAKVSHQPCAVWWASYQSGLHPEFIRLKHWNFRDRKSEQSKLVRQAWDYLIETWGEPSGIIQSDLYTLQGIVASDGWDNTLLREYQRLCAPRFQVRHTFWRGPKPPSLDVTQLNEVLQLDVEYAKQHFKFDIPDQWLASIIEIHRTNLELALKLENDIGGYGIGGLAPINLDGNEDKSYTFFTRTDGLSGYLISFAELFKRLHVLDPSRAKQEFNKWSLSDDTVFCRLRIWAAGLANFLNPDEFMETILQVSDRAFWSTQHQRDLLFTLKSKWNYLPIKLKKRLEKKLLKGSNERFKGESLKLVKERAVWSALNRVNWLVGQGCQFTFNIDEFNKKYSSKVPQWKPQFANEAADSSLGRGGFVKTERNYDVLLQIPISEILKTAIANNGRSEDFLVERDPYSGLCKDKPYKAFQALRYAASNQDFPEWAWSAFFNTEFRQHDKPKFLRLIAVQVCEYSDKDLMPLLYTLVNWFERVGEKLGEFSPLLFDKLINKFIGIIKQKSPLTDSVIVRDEDNEIDWMTEAINTPIGKLAQLLFRNDVFGQLEIAKGFPANWKQYAEALLDSTGDLRRYVITILNFNIRWFYAVDSNWVEKSLLSVLKSADPLDIDAFWSGLLSGTRYHSIELYSRLKNDIITLAKSSSLIKKSDSEVLASILLWSWVFIDKDSKERFIKSPELREIILSSDEDFKSTILWQLKGWVRHETDAQSNEDSIDLPDELIKFFTEVWPLQKSARTPMISAKIYDLAFSCRSNFPKMVEVILPLVTELQKNSHIHLNILAEDNVFSKYPNESLTLLHKALPSDITAWPYDTESVLKKIEESNAELSSDKRLVELFRLWNSR